MPSHFSFLQPVYPEIYGIGILSEKLYNVDPSSSIAKSRLFAEKLTQLIWDFEELDHFSGKQVERINQLAYRNVIPDIIKGILHTIRTSGNKASHDGTGSKPEALFILKKCFQLAKWFYETYENDYIAENNYQLPEENKLSVKELSEQVDYLSQQVSDYKEKIEQLNSSKIVTDSRKKRSERVAKKLNLSEKDTRLTLIDEQLRTAGWECDTIELNYKTHKTLPEKGRFMAILHKAFKGELVPQLENDGDARELLREIEQLKKETKSKK